MTTTTTTEIIMKTCKSCLEIKELSCFRLTRASCRKCVTQSQNAVQKGKNYFANKYIEQRDDRIVYSANYFQEVRKPQFQLKKELEKLSPLN